MLRWGLSFAAACAVALALFALMLGMITPRQPSEPEAPLRIADYVPFAERSDTPSRSRQPAPERPQPPTPQPPTPATPQPVAAAPSLPTLEVSLPTLDSNISLASAPAPSLAGLSAAPSAAAAAPAASSAAGPSGPPAQDSEVVPLNQVIPEYPRHALQRGIEGHVRLLFTITRDGRVENIRIAEARPRNVFEREARRAAARWRFAPRTENGLATEREAVKTLYFRLQPGGR